MRATGRHIPSGHRLKRSRCLDFLPGRGCEVMPYVWGCRESPILDRPYFDAAYRDQPFLRFWLPEGLLLKEVYQRNHFSGLDYIQSYLLPEAANGMAVEPDTYGLLVSVGTLLYYADRREPLPDGLEK